MLSELRETHNPIGVFCTRLFNWQSDTKGGSAQQAAVTLAGLAAKPKQTQLLLAHCLEQNNPDLMLLEYDTDVPELLSTSWLMSLPCSTSGFISLKIKPLFWRQLRSLGTAFLTTDLLSELSSYRKRKSVLYPWVWW